MVEASIFQVASIKILKILKPFSNSETVFPLVTLRAFTRRDKSKTHGTSSNDMRSGNMGTPLPNNEKAMKKKYL